MTVLRAKYQAILDRLDTALDARSGLTGSLRWVTTNTMLQDRKYNLNKHEAQIPWFMGGGVMEPHPRVAIKKPSQIGATETVIRLGVGMAAVMKGINIIYAMPTGKMAEKNSVVRIKPIIETSEALNYGKGTTQTTLLRQVGSSFIHLGGTQDSTGGAISTPAEAVILDEYDFMDMRVAGQYASRIRHATEYPIPGTDRSERGILYKFSTPTLPGYGIDLEVQNSDGMRYMVKCGRCNHRQAPDFFNDVVIPGWDDEIRKLRKEDLSDKILTSEAYLKCQKCGKALHEELLDKDREWVAMRPSFKDQRGFDTKPFDFYHFNTIPSLVNQIKEYHYADWVNFSIGEAYEDANQSFSTAMLDQIMNAPFVPPERADTLPRGMCSIGVDVGKTSDIVVGKVELDKDLLPTDISVYYWERYRPADVLKEDNELHSRVKKVREIYGARKAVIDHLPDQTAALKVSSESWGLQGFYPKTSTKVTTAMVSETEQNLTLGIQRTKLLNHILDLWNRGRVHLPRNQHYREGFIENFGNVKKIRSAENGDGTMSEQWVKVNEKLPDHFIHALVYMVSAAIASGSAAGYAPLPSPVGAPVGVKSSGSSMLTDKELQLLGLRSSERI